MKNNDPTLKFTTNLRAMALGILFCLMTIIFGQGLGILFGLSESEIKANLKASAEQVKDLVYNGEEAAVKAVLDKSWSYMQRAHLHAGAMGTTAMILILLISLLTSSRIILVLCSFGLGAGSFGYSLFWMWAGFRAPALGSTSVAKESLKWLAMPSSAAFVLSTLLVFFVFVRFMLTKTKAD